MKKTIIIIGIASLAIFTGCEQRSGRAHQEPGRYSLHNATGLFNRDESASAIYRIDSTTGNLTLYVVAISGSGSMIIETDMATGETRRHSGFLKNAK